MQFGNQYIIKARFKLWSSCLRLSSVRITGMCHDHWLIWCWSWTDRTLHPSQASYQLSYVPRPNALFKSQEHMQDITFCHHHSFNLQKMTAFQTFLLYDLEKVCVMLVCICKFKTHMPLCKHVGTRSRHHIPSSVVLHYSFPSLSLGLATLATLIGHWTPGSACL